MSKHLWPIESEGSPFLRAVRLMTFSDGQVCRREAVAKKHEGRTCASSPRHVLSRCYRGWDQDQISLARNW